MDHSEDKMVANHQPCPKCGSSDARVVYTDGAHCFSCGASFSPKELREEGWEVEDMVPVAKDDRRPKGLIDPEDTRPVLGFSERTVRKWGLRCGYTDDDSPVFIYEHRDHSGRLVAQHLRYTKDTDKDRGMPWLGDSKAVVLYGQWLWSPGKRVVITEGEKDAIAVDEALGGTWPVVSITRGAQSAKKEVLKHLDWLMGFDEIVLCFDMDEPGRKAVDEVAEVLPPDRVLVTHLSRKDAYEVWTLDGPKVLKSALWNSSQWKPDGIVDIDDIIDEVLEEQDEGPGEPTPFDGLNEIVGGWRTGEMVAIGAGTGVGKSTLVREFAYQLHMSGKKVAMIMLEESYKKTIWALIGMHLKKRLSKDRSHATKEEIQQARKELFGNGRKMYLYKHFGSLKTDKLLNRIRYMTKGLGVEFVFLDHISIAISGLEIDDERRAIDTMVTRLRALVEETDCCLFVVSHLKRPEGDRGFEQGREVTLGHFRGSHALPQLSDTVLGIERDTSDDDARDISRVRVLKNRWGGESGMVACRVKYNTDSGRCSEYAGPDHTGGYTDYETGDAPDNVSEREF